MKIMDVTKKSSVCNSVLEGIYLASAGVETEMYKHPGIYVVVSGSLDALKIIIIIHLN